MKNRGPYANGSYNFFLSKIFNINFLNTRPGIIDLDKRSNQPFKDGDLKIIFNCEIYNYLKIKKKSKSKYSLSRKRKFYV
jgi:asparagine synthetase B (glutamine-hydrolysing)